MRFTLGATIVLMGVLVMAFALTTGEIYRRQALANQRTTLEEMVRITASQQLRDLEERAGDLGLAIRGEAGSGRALASGKRDVLVRQLQVQLRQYSVTANFIKLDKLVVYDSGYRPLGAIKAGGARGTSSPGCPALIERARTRSGAERAKIIA